MLVSMAMCTLNRAGSLQLTRASLAVMSSPDDVAWKVVVVNKCTDTVIESFGDMLPK